MRWTNQQRAAGSVDIVEGKPAFSRRAVDHVKEKRQVQSEPEVEMSGA
jgi:hypothetical protein